MTALPPAAYASQTRWSDPGPYAAALSTLPADPARMPRAFAGLLQHPASVATRAMGGVPPTAGGDRELRRADDLLALLLARDPAPLDCPRPPERRAFGVCRHFALLASARLRAAGVPARLRVGFAFYFTPGFGEDHWVCEWHDGSRWRLLDAELDEAPLTRLRIVFDPTDVPRTVFMAAGPAWRRLRTGELDGNALGVDAIGVRGAWFAAGSLLRDLAVLAREEAVLPWDYWGPARALGPGSELPLEWLPRLDTLAEALAAEPDGLAEAEALRQANPWAEPPRMVLSYPHGAPVVTPFD
jgi:hypothetical protein